MGLAETNLIARRSRKRRHSKRLTEFEKPGVVNYWMTQKMLRPFLLCAETYRHNEGSQIADQSHYNVEEGSAFGDNLAALDALDAGIDQAKRMKIPAKDVIDALYHQTKLMAHRINDQTGWPATYFGLVVDRVIQRFPRDRKYGEELKRKALNQPLPV